jgi:hypothetical protein
MQTVRQGQTEMLNGVQADEQRHGAGVEYMECELSEIEGMDQDVR